MIGTRSTDSRVSRVSATASVMGGGSMIGLYPRRMVGGKNPDAQKTRGVDDSPAPRRCAGRAAFLRRRVEVVRCDFHRQRAGVRRGISFAKHAAGRFAASRAWTRA